MAIESVAARMNGVQIDKMSERQLRAVLAALVDSVQSLASKMDTLATKLNNDAGVTDVNYATDFATTTAAIITD